MAYKLTITGEIDFVPEDNHIKEFLQGPYSLEQLEVAVQDIQEMATNITVELVEIK